MSSENAVSSVQSDSGVGGGLSGVMDAVALILAFVSVIGSIALVKYELYWALPYSILTLASTPFLLGFSDLVRSARAIASKK